MRRRILISAARPEGAVRYAAVLAGALCACSSTEVPTAGPAAPVTQTAGVGAPAAGSTQGVAGTRAAASGSPTAAGRPAAASGGRSGTTIAGASSTAGQAPASTAGQVAAAAGMPGRADGAGQTAMAAGAMGATGRSSASAGEPAAGMAGQAGIPAAGSGGMATCTPPSPGSKGKNPLFTDQYTADPGALVDGCTFYIHCGHDEGPNGFVLKEWFVLSSTNMVDWKKQVAMRLSDFKWADINAWAGQVVKKDGKYYWFVPVNERGGGMAIGVAVADSPLGPFKDAIGKPLINDAFEMSNAGFKTPSDTPFTIDPSVFVDADGQAYLHYGGFSRMMVAKLNADMVSIDGKLQEVTPRGFFEAPFLFKHLGKYYEVYAAGTNPATIDYSTSSSALGPWTYGGRILDALPAVAGQDAPTSHPAVAQFADQWYLVYHLSNGPNGGGTYKREVAVDKLTFTSDGKIQKLTPTSGLSF